MSHIIPFERTFNATDMTVDEIRQKARGMGWLGVHMDIDRFKATGVMVAARLTRKEAYNE